VPLTDEERQQLAEDYNSLAFYQEKLNQSNNKDRHKPNETIVKYYLKSLDYKARVETHANLAELYFRMGNYAGSAKHYKQVIQLSEVEKTEVEDFEREQLIKSYFKLKMYSEAKQEFLNLTRPSIEMLELEIEI
jgi:tetratricopeptide (TPR) repeat protein